jgi:hypothetical protein
MRSTLAPTIVCALAASGPALAVDRWEAGGQDGGPSTFNELRHGTLQAGHDFTSDVDQDWALVVTQARHSYEVRAGSGTAAWFRVTSGPSCAAECATLDRVDAAGTVLTAGSGDSGDPALGAGSSSARWIADTGAEEFVRTRAFLMGGQNYDLQFFDTTYLIPRFNNSGTQATVLLVQNGSRFAVDAQVHFYDGAGTLLHSQPLSLPVQGNAVFNTASVAALQNVSGTAMLAHTAPYGTLAGKAVALEPGTGFTFETPLTPIPY